MRENFRFLTSLFGAALVAAIPMAAAEGIARWVTVRIVAQSYEAHNNPLKDRFWRQYTAPVDSAGGRHIIVITNSQGHLSEANPEQGYSSQLERLLNEHDSKHAYHVTNWALPGANATEMVILAARAADIQPDAILLVTFSNNFSEGHNHHPLSFARNDVEQLAYLPQVRRRISSWFLDRYNVSRPRGWLAAHTGLINLHDSLVFWLRDDRDLGERLFQSMQDRPAIPVQKVSDDGMRLMREIRNVLQRGLPHTPVLVVSMPLSERKVLPETWLYADSFFEEAQMVFNDKKQFTVVDAKQVVDSVFFYTASHMRPEGHRLFAEWLLPYVLHLLNHGESNVF